MGVSLSAREHKCLHQWRVELEASGRGQALGSEREASEVARAESCSAGCGCAACACLGHISSRLVVARPLLVAEKKTTSSS